MLLKVSGSALCWNVAALFEDLTLCSNTSWFLSAWFVWFLRSLLRLYFHSFGLCVVDWNLQQKTNKKPWGLEGCLIILDKVQIWRVYDRVILLCFLVFFRLIIGISNLQLDSVIILRNSTYCTYYKYKKIILPQLPYFSKWIFNFSFNYKLQII